MQQDKFIMDEEGTLDTVEYTLINLVRGATELYNPQDPGYRDKARRDLAWSAIARQLNKDEIWCYSKWRNLVDYYKKRKKAYDTGTMRITQRWVYYDALSFLDLCENGNRDRDAISENSISSIRSANEHFEEESNHQNYFNETQYPSLDALTERAAAVGSIRNREETEPRLHNLPDPLSDYVPPVKRQREAAPLVRVVEYASTGPASTASTSRHFPTEADSKGPLILKVQSSKESNSCQPLPVPISNVDCPHHHFCMSLLSRFRKMEPGTATYVQMKIMEVILKAEFPNEYKKRLSDND